jgi:PKD repeat protein
MAMKKISPLLLLIQILLQIGLYGQPVVVDYGFITSHKGLSVVPDVDGKVLIGDDMKWIVQSEKQTDSIALYPNWPLQYTGSSSRGGIYCNLDADPDLEIVYNVGQQVYAWKMDGSVVPGWPVTTPLWPDGAPAYGDITGDGAGEIVVSTRQAGTGNTGRLLAYKTDGTLVPGFPVVLTGGATKTPVLADLDGDGILEIIIEERSWPNGYVGVYKGNGQPFPGFPVTLDYIPASAVAVGDINGDGVPEIIAQSYYSVYAFDITGSVLPGFPFTPGNDRVFSYSSPVLADIDGDGYREIIVGDHSLTAGNGAIHVLKNNGVPLAGWPKYTNYWIYGPAAVGDINGDGNLEIAVGDQVLSGVPSNKVYVWDKNGNLMPGWPTPAMNAINNQIILADLDGDNEVELMWDDNTNAGVYIGYNHDGTPMTGWPLTVTGSSFFMNPFVVDINNDGIIDISGASSNISTNDLYFYLWNANVPVNPAKSPLTILQYNVRHDGVYMDPMTLNADFFASSNKICQEQSIQFTDQSNGNVTGWNWTFEGGTPDASTEENPSVFYENPGKFDVSLTITDGTNSSTLLKENFIRVDDDPVVPDQPVGPTDVITSQTLFTFYETSSENADSYIWELNPPDVGLIISGDTITQVKVYWSQASSYSAQLKVKAVNACGESEFSEPLTIYVNWNTEVPVNEQQKPFIVFPNPTQENIFVKFNPETEVRSIRVRTQTGKNIFMQEHGVREEGLFEINLENVSQGVYFLEVETVHGRFVEKIVVL